MSFESLTNKKIAIIGGTGTLGKAIVDHLIELNKPVEILIVSRDEVKQLEMMNDYNNTKKTTIKYLLGDVRDSERMQEVLANTDIVIHLAAIKHVVMAENNPDECYKTNVIGTKNIVDASQTNSISQAILISTDKAEKPIGVYGKSKWQAEQLFLDAAQSGTKFSVIRLGNIIGSRASVSEVFEKQKNRQTIQVSHPDATRFFISKKKAAAFVLNTIESPDADDIIFPKMKSLRIVDLAESICPNCKIEFTGLRPGDKLHEELGGVSSKDVIEKSAKVIN
jgi:UDP-N-acetylglucosamine 4,6-dehydratase